MMPTIVGAPVARLKNEARLRPSLYFAILAATNLFICRDAFTGTLTRLPRASNAGRWRKL